MYKALMITCREKLLVYRKSVKCEEFILILDEVLRKKEVYSLHALIKTATLIPAMALEHATM
jgi:hypothetical protein